VSEYERRGCERREYEREREATHHALELPIKGLA
jgi:hypothetical protein